MPCKRKIPTLARRIVTNLGLLQLLHDVGAQRYCIADGFQRKGVIRHAGNHTEIDCATAGDDAGKSTADDDDS